MTDLDVLIVTWNNEQTIGRCLDAAVCATREMAIGVHVWDNASSDQTIAKVELREDVVGLIRSEANLGFAAANNRLAANCRAPFLLLLNPDAYVEPPAVRALLAAARDSGAAIVGGALCSADGTPLATSARPFPRAGAIVKSLMRRVPSSGSRPMPRGEVDAVSGGFMLVSRELWAKLNGFDARFLHGAEDLEFCLRARNAGAKIFHEPDARALHEGQTSVRQQPAEIEALRWAGLVRFVRGLSGAHAAAGVRLVLALQTAAAIVADAARIRRADAYRRRRSRVLFRWATTGSIGDVSSLPDGSYGR